MHKRLNAQSLLHHFRGHDQALERYSSLLLYVAV